MSSQTERPARPTRMDAAGKLRFIKAKAPGVIFRLFRFFFIFGLSYLFLFPVFYMLSTALQSPDSVSDPSVIWIPKELSLVAFKGAIEFLNFLPSLKLTATITVFSTIATLCSCSLAGYAFARFKFPFKNLIFGFVVLMIIIPPQIFVMTNYLQYAFFDFGGLLAPFGVYFNLLGTPWVFILPSIFASGLRAGLFIFIFRQFFKGLPIDLEEAARIDGCGAFKTFVRIMMPLAVPAFVTVMLFSFIWHWNEYYNSAIYFVGEVKPLTVMLQNMESALRMGGIIGYGASAYQFRMYIQAGALLTIIIPLLLYVFTQKFFTESIERTGIVG